MRDAPEQFLEGRVVLHAGDCLDVIASLPDESIDATVCDPPYALVSIGKRFGAAGATAPKAGKSGAYQRAAAGFMGKKWDTGETAFAVEFWAQALRVLKPGGHVVAFGGTRTYHRLACAIEDAGFEIRDQLAWCYGTGFPKSHDVAKGIQSRRVEDAVPVRSICRAIRAAMDAKGLKSSDLVPAFGGCHPRLIDHWAARDTDSQPSLPTWEQWLLLKGLLDLGEDLDAEVWRLDGRKGTPGTAWSEAQILGEKSGNLPGFAGTRFAATDATIRAASPEAEPWEGWGTALKPSWEPIVLARKPLVGTVAENVLRYGTGALNIDGCRVGSDARSRSTGQQISQNRSMAGANYAREIVGTVEGRFPANIVTDGSDEVLSAFPDAGGGFGRRGAGGQNGVYSPIGGTMQSVGFGDSGSAARFFYSAKADSDTRLGSKHPTVKPVDLMQWLCRLVTPPGGTVLDPFAGTGTTGEAAWREGFCAVLIEREAEYCSDIARRMALALAGPATRRAARSRLRTTEDNGPLFRELGGAS